MRRIKLIFAAIAAFTGIGGAIASTVKEASPGMIHDWVNLNNETILYNQTTLQAQAVCHGQLTICLKAKDNYFVTTKGTLDW